MLNHRLQPRLTGRLIALTYLLPFVLTTLGMLVPLAAQGAEPATSKPLQAVRAVAAKPETEYRLSPFDKVQVSVYGEPDLATTQLITDSGTASVPLVGTVTIGGKTVKEASLIIAQSFIDQQYLRKPVVTVSIEEFAPKVLTVMGEVNKPGTVQINPGLNGLPIQIAIAEAGGFKNTAKTTEVTVTRATSAEGEAPTAVVNVDRLLQSKSDGVTEPPFIIRTGDVVYVPRRVF
ncbi:polysaccharide biosynthesis/export family protein [Coraliomargarita parva]|uniref:polysaccharide biosynthesis/export family protein n=1 Tax=Coraliomargarita parva TaxID=3014050 RepID=UPI0022B5DE77|nr:polysaccharide biosynthesis/export family protein [Coraliomargarita parva]